MGSMSGEEAAAYIYSDVIPKVRACGVESKRAGSPRARLVAQINCVERAFGKE